MTSSYKRSLYSSIVRIVANVVMIGAVFLGMYMASRSPMSSMHVLPLVLWHLHSCLDGGVRPDPQDPSGLRR